MKAVILAGGAGTRLRPITFSMAKQLVPVGNKPIIEYGLNDIRDAGIQEVAIVISPETGDEVRRSLGAGERFGLKISYIVQEKPLGLAHALAIALPWVDEDDVLMYLGDNLVKGGVSDVVADFMTHDPNCQILLCPVDDPTGFGIAALNADGSIDRLVEKPKDPPSNLALVGVYLFDATIAEAVASIKPSSRGELEITDAIQYLVDSGRLVQASVVQGWWKDTGRKMDLLHANELLLADLPTEVEGELVDTQVRGPIQVGTGSRLIDCTVTGPAVIGSNAHLTRTTIGPNTAIGDNTRIVDAVVEGSIIMDGSEVHGWRLRESLLGRHARLHGSAPNRFVEMTLGERSEIIGE